MLGPNPYIRTSFDPWPTSAPDFHMFQSSYISQILQSIFRDKACRPRRHHLWRSNHNERNTPESQRDLKSIWQSTLRSLGKCPDEEFLPQGQLSIWANSALENCA